MSDALANRTAIKRVEDVLFTAINSALRVRAHAPASVSALRGVATAGATGGQAVVDGRLAIISGTGLYQWSRTSTATDDGSTVIKPADAGATGRWLKQSNPGGTTYPLCLRGDDVTAIASGYLQSVILGDGQIDDAEWRERTFQRRPAVVLDFTGWQRERAGTNPGQLTKGDFSFLLWVVDENQRGDMVALRGSDVTTEATRSPGAYAIVGDLIDLLDGVTGEQLGEAGIAFARCGNATPGPRLLKGRHVVWTVELGVWATTSRRGSNAVALDSLNGALEHALARPADEDVNRDSVIVNGLRVSLGAGLSLAPSNGGAVISGTAVTVSGAASHTFTAWRDTYRDLRTDGTFYYTEVASWATAPAVASGSLRIGYTRTNSTDATDDVLLAPTLRTAISGFVIAP